MKTFRVAIVLLAILLAACTSGPASAPTPAPVQPPVQVQRTPAPTAAPAAPIVILKQTIIRVDGRGDLGAPHGERKEGAPYLGSCMKCHPMAEAIPGGQEMPKCAAAPATPCEKCPPPAPCLLSDGKTITPTVVVSGSCPAGGTGSGLPEGVEDLSKPAQVVYRVLEPQGKTWKSFPQSVSQEGGELLSLAGTTAAYVYRYPGSGGASYLSWYTGKQTGYYLMVFQGQGEGAVVNGVPAGMSAEQVLQVGPPDGPILVRSRGSGWEYTLP